MREDPQLISEAQPQDYHRHYGLTHAPFSIESDTSLFVLSAGHETALDKLYRALLDRKSFLLITGAAGTGKTLLLQTLIRLTAEQCNFVQIHPEDLGDEDRGSDQLSTLLLSAAGVPSPTPNRELARRADKNAQLREYLEKQKSSKEGKRLVVAIDEAQLLSDRQLESLRCWSNLDNHAGRTLHFVLAGHKSLGRRLNCPQLANLKQRIGMRCELPPLDLLDTQRYIAHRALLAGASEPLFEHSVIIRIYSLTRGLPRMINTVADALLLQAYLRGSRAVTLADVAQVVKDLDLRYAPIINRPDTAVQGAQQ